MGEDEGSEVANAMFDDLLRSYLFPEIAPDAIEERASELQADVDQLLARFENEKDRRDAAETMINVLLPNMVDLRVWRDLAHGKRIDLPASDQYGSAATRNQTAAGHSKGTGRDGYGKVHSKGEQSPSAFMSRQGDALRANARNIARAEAQLDELRQTRDELSHGVKLYAVTCLLIAMRKAVSPIFAAGPAWTVLSAIAGPTGSEVNPADRGSDTGCITTVLHALRDDGKFKGELKAAILAVCSRYRAEAGRQQNVSWDWNEGYADILTQLGWPVESGIGES